MLPRNTIVRIFVAKDNRTELFSGFALVLLDLVFYSFRLYLLFIFYFLVEISSILLYMSYIRTTYVRAPYS